MGNQVTSQQPSESQPPSKQLQTRQPEKQKGRKLKKPHWLTGKRQRASGPAEETPNKSSSKNGNANNSSSVAKASNTSNRERQPPTSLVQALEDTNKSKDEALTTTAVHVVAELTPTPDSANRTWSDEASLHPPEKQRVESDEKLISGHRQRDSGISQLSTEEFERAFEELAARCAADQRRSSPEPTVTTSSPEVAEMELHELLGPRLRPKRSPALRHQARGALDAAAAALVATEEQLLLRQELLLLTPSSLADDSGRHSACSVVNDDHLFPDSVTPCKVDSGLLADYDVPYMDDETFFVLDDWYITDDRRWSYLRRSDTPQLASWEDCQLTVSAPVSPKATPRVTPRGLFGLCFGVKSRT